MFIDMKKFHAWLENEEKIAKEIEDINSVMPTLSEDRLAHNARGRGHAFVKVYNYFSRLKEEQNPPIVELIERIEDVYASALFESEAFEKLPDGKASAYAIQAVNHLQIASQLLRLVEIEKEVK